MVLVGRKGCSNNRQFGGQHGENHIRFFVLYFLLMEIMYYRLERKPHSQAELSLQPSTVHLIIDLFKVIAKKIWLRPSWHLLFVPVVFEDKGARSHRTLSARLDFDCFSS